MTKRRPARPYTLTISASQGLLLTVRRTNAGAPAGHERLARLRGTNAELARPHIGRLLHRSKLRYDEDASVARVRLPEAVGARVATLMWGAQPLRRPARVEMLCQGVLAMSDEEIYYWYSKVHGNGKDGVEVSTSHALTALRVLPSGE